MSSTVSAPGVALEIVGEESVARFADALVSPALDQYAKAPWASKLSAIMVVAAIRRSVLRRFGLMSASLRGSGATTVAVASYLEQLPPTVRLSWASRRLCSAA